MKGYTNLSGWLWGNEACLHGHLQPCIDGGYFSESLQRMNDHIAIVGAGLAGQLTALCLARQGCRVSLIDRQSLDFLSKMPDQADAPGRVLDHRTTAFSSKSIAFMTQMGLWDALTPYGCAVHAMHLGAGHSVPQALGQSMTLNREDAGQESLAWIVENHALLTTLREALAAHMASGALSLHGCARVVDVDLSGRHAVIDLGDLGIIEADLLVGCDGRQSRIRRLCMNDVATHANYQHSALVGVLCHEVPHDHVASQMFLGDGPVALLPMNNDADGRARSSLIWSATSPWVRTMADMSPPALATALSDRLGDITGMITAVGSVAAYPLHAAISARFTAQSVALIGDAAHAVHPLAGQGFNLAVGDIQALSDGIQSARHLGQPIGSALMLEGYGKARQAEAQKIFMLTDGLHRLFHRNNPLATVLQRFAFPTLNQAGPLKESLIHLALG